MRRDPATPQPRVPPEAPSWRVERFDIEHFTAHGDYLTKAHQIDAVGTDARGAPRYRPRCGAALAYLHDPDPAPVGWPACRHCWTRATPAPLPAAFTG